MSLHPQKLGRRLAWRLQAPPELLRVEASTGGMFSPVFGAAVELQAGRWRRERAEPRRTRQQDV